MSFLRRRFRPRRLSVVYQLTEKRRGRRSRCKTGVAYLDRFDRRMSEHENGRVKSVAKWTGKVTVKIHGVHADRKRASKHAHDLETRRRCVKTPGE